MSTDLRALPSVPATFSGWPWTETTPEATYENTPHGGWPKLSIICPSLQQGAFIEMTIRSVLLQNYPNLEFIVIDGESTDTTVPLLRRYAPWIAHWESRPDRGQSHALNKACDRATGEIIGWINSDDYYLPGAFAAVARSFRLRGPALIYGDWAECHGTEPPHKWFYEVPAFGFQVAYGVVHPPSHATFWPRTAHLPFDETLRFTMDADLYRRLAAAGLRPRHIPILLGVFRRHGEAKTSVIADRSRAELAAWQNAQTWQVRQFIAFGRTLHRVRTSVSRRLGRGHASTALALLKTTAPSPLPPTAMLSVLPPPPAHQTGWPWIEETPLSAYDSPLPGGWPKISIVCPSFQQGAYIEETLRSVLLQNYPRLEFIVVDGGSRDETPALLQRYAPWLAHWESQPDRGQSHALNKACDRATGEIIGWINSDDYYLPGAFAAVARTFRAAPRSLIYGDWSERQDTLPALQSYHEHPAFRFQVAVGGRHLPSHATFWPRFAHLPINEELRFTMDADLFKRLAASGLRPRHIVQPLAVFRQHAAAKSSTIVHIARAETAAWSAAQPWHTHPRWVFSNFIERIRRRFSSRS